MNAYTLLMDVLIGCLLLNGVVSWLVVRHEGLTLHQKGWQLIVVWLVPVVGSLLIFTFHVSQGRPAPPIGYPAEHAHRPEGLETLGDPSPPASRDS